MQNASGKTLTIFIVLIIILLISSTSIGFFLYHKERDIRKTAEVDLEAGHESEAKLQAELKDIKKQLVILQDKNKEADGKINNLLDEMELNEGLRKEMKTENASLKESLEAAKKEKEKARADLQEATDKLKTYEKQIADEQGKSKDLETRLKEAQQAQESMQAKIGEMRADAKVSPVHEKLKENLELDKIVVSPQDGVKGRVLTIDRDAEFIVCNLGIKQGIKFGDTLGIYRGEEYLGDVKVSRVQDEMSAADIIPPFSSRKVRKNDIVILKP